MPGQFFSWATDKNLLSFFNFQYNKFYHIARIKEAGSFQDRASRALKLMQTPPGPYLVQWQSPTMENKNRISSLIPVLLICLALLTGSSSARAQSGNNIQISLPDTSAYPTITIYIDPTDRNGSPVENLKMDQITLIEDGINRDLLQFQALNPGIQLVFAFNFSPAFAIQDINGRSRYDFIQEALLNWANQPLETAGDDLSILDNLDLEQAHLDGKADFIEALEGLDPALRETESNYNLLARAIEIASDPVSQPGMKKVVLLFSPQPESDSFEALDSLTAQAKDQQVKVYTIMISSPAFFETAGAENLQTLSAETGGKFLTFTGEEPLADLGQLLLPLRTTYMLEYQSSIVTPGIHTLEVSISATPSDIVGLREFTLDIQPPNPIFITPPRTITRTPLEQNQRETDQAKFEPTSVTLPVLVEFPDRHPRDLAELIFRVDGEIVETKTNPPYDQFIWDLEEYQASGTHYLTLEAVDIMGLSRLSLETPIEIEVIRPSQDIWEVVKKNGPALLGLALILLLGLTLFVLISRGKIKPRDKRGSSWLKKQGNQAAAFIKQTLKRRNPPPGSKDLAYSPYRLIAVNDISRELFPEPIQINQALITLGSVKAENVIRIQHPSIIPEHTRISAEGKKDFQIIDLGSAAGTWVNYEQIPPSIPHTIKDGDIINIGEAAFRFQIKNGPNSRAADKENVH